LADVMARLKRGVDPGVRDAAMSDALIDDDPCMTVALLRAGADPNRRAPEGLTPLMAAVISNAPRSAKALLEAGADVNATAKLPSSKLGKTALSWAVGTGNQEMIRLLRDAGARE
jgi:ankyrin repeat protein